MREKATAREKAVPASSVKGGLDSIASEETVVLYSREL